MKESKYYEYLSLLAKHEGGTKGLQKRLKEIEHELGMSRREILRISAKEVLDKYTST